MKQYLNLVEKALRTGNYKQNRTAVDTISTFSANYTVDLSKGFPLLTTKDLSGYRWESLKHEMVWYLSGEEHIRNLQENTKIWNAWANDKGQLDTAYGRFWRKFPMPESKLEGEAWPNEPHDWLNDDGTFDQIQYVIDQLNENPQTRRLVVSAWHPANAAVSKLPPCHYTFVMNVQGSKLNCHLTQRSGDIGLGIPFNIAAYSILTHLIANQTEFSVGNFSHTIVDAHAYCGVGERGKWYRNNIDKLQEEMESLPSGEITDEHRSAYKKLRKYILKNAPQESKQDEDKDHIPGLLKQLSREPRDKPQLDINTKATVDTLTADNIHINDYTPYSGIKFNVAE